jgi:hypothetical protein
MEKFKEIMNRLLYPNTFVFILCFVIGFGSVIATFLLRLENNAFGYISYILSAYALIITIAKLPNIYKKCYEKLDNMKYSNKFIHDTNFRNLIALYLGFIFNIMYIGYKFTIGIVFHSAWLGATAIYYLLLISIRYYLLRNIKRDISYEKKVRVYRLIGILIFLLTIVIAGMSISIITGHKTISYSGHIIYVVALYTFYNFVTAIFNLVKYRKMYNPIFSSVKMISLVTACMSMLVLQTALISAFGDDENFGVMMNSITGIGVILSVISIAIYMIKSSTKIIKQIKENEN